MNQPVRSIRLRHLVAYGTGDIYGNGAFVIVSLLFMFFLTDVVGITPTLAGFVVLTGKLWDAFSDPLMGYISDNIKTRFGRRRVFFLAGFIPVAISFFLLWVDIKSESQVVTFIYYSFTYLLFSTVFTMVMIPYRALNAEMTDDYVIRTRLTGSKMICAQIGGLLSATLPKIIVDRLFPGDPSLGFLVMGLIFGVFFAVPWIIVFFGTWEAEGIVSEDKDTRSFFRQFLTLLKSRTFRIHMGLYISAFSALDMLMALFIYYLTHYLQKEGMYSPCMGAMIITSMLMISLYVAFANRNGKGIAYVIGMVIWGIGISGFAALSAESAPFLLILCAMLAGAGMAAGTVMPWAMLPSLIDVDELIAGVQRAGLCSGAMTLIRKMVQAVVLFILGITLDLIGYLPNSQQSPETLEQLRILFFVAPLLFIVIGIFFGLKFGVTPETHAALKNQLERFRADASADPISPADKAVCEKLTGIMFEKLFGAGTKPMTRRT